MLKKKFSTLDMTYVALFAVLITLCAWVSIPTVPPFTLQTLGIMLAASLLGWKRGTAAVLIYILLGAVGLPVFAGFKGGLSALVGPTGGYIIGFVFTALITGLGRRKDVSWLLLVHMVLGVAVCYIFGTIWYVVIQLGMTNPTSFGTALGLCVIPFILPDLAKIVLAFFLTKRLSRFIRE